MTMTALAGLASLTCIAFAETLYNAWQHYARRHLLWLCNLQEAKAFPKKAHTRHKLMQSTHKADAPERHLSSYAVKQLLAQGVPSQVLDTILAGTAGTPDPQQHQHANGHSAKHNTVKPRVSVAEPKASDRKPLTSRAAELEAKQGRIMSCIMALEAAGAGRIPAACLQWMALTVDYEVRALQHTGGLSACKRSLSSALPPDVLHQAAM